MLLIREEQMRAFRDDAERRFEQRLLAHLRRMWADRCDALGEAGLARAVRDGCARASRDGIHTERDIARFLDVMFAVEVDLESWEAPGWFTAILGDERLSGKERVDQLCARALLEGY